MNDHFAAFNKENREPNFCRPSALFQDEDTYASAFTLNKPTPLQRPCFYEPAQPERVLKMFNLGQNSLSSSEVRREFDRQRSLEGGPQTESFFNPRFLESQLQQPTPDWSLNLPDEPMAGLTPSPVMPFTIHEDHQLDKDRLLRSIACYQEQQQQECEQESECLPRSLMSHPGFHQAPFESRVYFKQPASLPM